MFNRLKQNNMLSSTYVLVWMTIFCLALSLGRVVYTDQHTFIFLIWNLFLAFIPWLFSMLPLIFNIKSKIILTVIILCWVVFVPNAPYLLTDIIHLNMDMTTPEWFNLLFLLSYAFTGLFYAFVSLRNIEVILSSYFNQTLVHILSILLIYLSCFGVYLGRFLRWNSWDIFHNPHPLFFDIVGRIIYPSQFPKTWAFTVLLGTMLNLVYWSYKSFNNCPITSATS